MKKSGRMTLQIVCCALMLMGMVWQRIEATSLGYAVENSRDTLSRLEGENAQLEKKAGQNMSCAGLAQAAGAKLGMVPAPLTAERALPDSPLAPTPTSFLSGLLTRVWHSARMGARLFSS